VQVRQHDLKAVHPAMSVTAKDTLSHVIGRLAAARVHRLFVVDHGRPVSVISLTDILRYIYLVSLVKGDE
jgi:CBS domain-containing protein